MGFFRLPRFVRRFLRKHTAYIPEAQALQTKKKLSMVYAFVAWNLFGVILFYSVKGRNKDEVNSDVPWYHGKVFNLDTATHYRVKGFNVAKVEDKANEESKEV